MRAGVAIALVALAALAGRAQEPAVYVSAEGKFAAKFPTQPGTVVSTVKAKAAGQEVAVATSDNGPLAFTVGYSDLPAAALKDAPAAKVLEKSEQGLSAQTRAKVLTAKATTVKAGAREYPARELTAEREGVHLRIVVLIADTRLYQVSVVGSKDGIASKEADAFFASFEIRN